MIPIDEKWLRDVQRIIDEAGTNLTAAREGKQFGSANGALELIGKATGCRKTVTKR